jgi:hypothetical protein
MHWPFDKRAAHHGAARDAGERGDVVCVFVVPSAEQSAVLRSLGAPKLGRWAEQPTKGRFVYFL